MNLDFKKPLLVDVNEAARMVGSTHWTLRKLAAAGRIASHRVGSRLMFSPADLQKFVLAHRRPATAEPTTGER